jgi:PAS domain S-box-containing protein
MSNPSLIHTGNMHDENRTFEDLANYAPVMMWLAGVDKMAQWHNKPWYEFTGRTIEQELGLGWTEGIHPDDYALSVEIYTKAFDAREPFSMDYRLRRHDGEYRWIVDCGNPKYAADGTFTGYIGYCADIQDRKDLELALSAKSAALEETDIQLRASIKKSESRTRLYETILSAMPDFVYTFEFGAHENDHRFGYANQGLLKMFGRTFEETVGKTFMEVGYEQWHADLHNREIELVRATKQPIRGEVPFNGTYGRRIYDYIFAPVFDVHGEVEVVAGITRDVTERHNTEEILKRNEEALLLASKRKDEFLAMLAHELRNPLAPISAATQIMTLSDYDVTRVRKYSQVIERQVKHMVDLIDDLLDVSRVTRGLVQIQKTPQDLKAVLSASIEQVKPLMDAKHQQLQVNSIAGPISVSGDHKRLVQIISNVLNNAAKYTQERGNITLDVAIEGHAVVINVADDGIGITMEDQANIFELFAQAKRSSDRSQGGLGIGLALVKSLLDLHNGTILCMSEGLGKGSQFTITLPLISDHQFLTSPQQPGRLDNDAPLAIMVVDDNVDAAMSLAEVLKLHGHHVAVEHDSYKALTLITSQVPDICILDIGLPELDGNELAKRVRSESALQNTLLVAVTGYGQETDKQAALNAGFHHHLVKPVDYEKLFHIIKTFTRNKGLSKPQQS